jgi:hypothetical protein
MGNGMAINNDKLRAINAGWLKEHRKAFGGCKRIDLVVRYVSIQTMRYRDKAVVSMPNAHGQWRPAAEWDVDVEEAVEVVEERRFWIDLSTAPKKTRRLKRITTMAIAA